MVLSKDERIRRNRIERETLEVAHVRAFFLTQQDITGQEIGSPNKATTPRLRTW